MAASPLPSAAAALDVLAGVFFSCCIRKLPHLNIFYIRLIPCLMTLLILRKITVLLERYNDKTLLSACFITSGLLERLSKN